MSQKIKGLKAVKNIFRPKILRFTKNTKNWRGGQCQILVNSASFLRGEKIGEKITISNENKKSRTTGVINILTISLSLLLYIYIVIIELLGKTPNYWPKIPNFCSKRFGQKLKIDTYI